MKKYIVILTIILPFSTNSQYNSYKFLSDTKIITEEILKNNSFKTMLSGIITTKKILDLMCNGWCKY